jgi:DNA-binding MarR family transcriptional regulator
MTTLNDIVQSKALKDQCACFSVRKAARSITHLYDGVISESGIHAAQFSLLQVAKFNKDIRLTDMANAAVMNRTTLTRNLKPLIEKGYLIVRQGDDDKRIKIINITVKGLDILKYAEPLWEQAQSDFASKIGLTSFEYLLSELSELIRKMKG